MTRPTPGFLALHTAVPDICISQEDAANEFARAVARSDRRARAIKMIFERTGVQQRYMARPPQWLHVNRTTKERNDAYMEAAIPLGEKALAAAIVASGTAPADAGDFSVVSCTGINVPGLDLHLAGRLGLPHSLRRTCVLGMGCYGAFPGLRRAYDAVQREPDKTALMYAVELCTLHVQHNDDSENVISTALFADGGAAVVLGDRANEGLPHIIDFATHSDYTTLDHMAFELGDHGFLMYLSSYVPDVLAAHVNAFVEGLLERNGLRVDDVKHWGIHPGSTKIVDYIQGQLGLRDDQVDVSHNILAEYGNMSSATVLFVLEAICETKAPSAGDYGLLLAFGPGLTMEAMLLRW